MNQRMVFGEVRSGGAQRRRRWLFTLALGATAALAVAGWQRTTRDAPARYDRAPLRGDMVRAVDARLVVAARALPRPAPRPPTVVRHGRGLLDIAFAPGCLFGSRALCDALDALRDACDGGDAGACGTLGEFLAGTPHVVEAMFAFDAACRAGDAAACADVGPDGTGAAPGMGDFREFARAYRGDRPTLERLCTRGVASACGRLAALHLDQPAAQRRDLTRACELGSRLACDHLAERLAPTCVGDCLPADPVDARTAAALACEAGFAASCARLAR